MESVLATPSVESACSLVVTTRKTSLSVSTTKHLLAWSERMLEELPLWTRKLTQMCAGSGGCEIRDACKKNRTTNEADEKHKMVFAGAPICL